MLSEIFILDRVPGIFGRSPYAIRACYFMDQTYPHRYFYPYTGIYNSPRTEISNEKGLSLSRLVKWDSDVCIIYCLLYNGTSKSQ